MKSTTYYIVELDRGVFAKRWGNAPDLYSGTMFPSDATHYSLSEARRVAKWERRERDAETPRRYPQIIKVSTEYKTITNRR